MTQQKIQVSNYFPPVHLQPFIAQQYGHQPGDFPICEAAGARTIALPFHTQLTQEDVALVCGALRGILDAGLA
jgi:perosamine synthetase